jgi:alkylation response protein AidB-like acyl-CoA dehydrogenase
MLARYALWSIQAGRRAAVADALALRLAAIEAAGVVFRVAHQVHGAIGFSDDKQLSWLSRYSQPLRRLPLGLSATRAALVSRAGRRGLDGLFNE